MNDASKVKPSHIQRSAFVYIRQSSPAQVEYNRESTARQYALVERACQLGWTKQQVIVIKAWTAPTTTDRDRKELLRALLEEVIVTVDRAERRGHLTLRWRGGTLTEFDLSLPRMKPRGLHTNEETISLLRRLAAHYPDEVIAGIPNRQGRETANGERFTANQVGSLRRYRNIPRYEPPAEPPTGEVVPIRKAAQILGVYTSTIHRWLNDGFIAGEQLTPGAPWQIRITDELRARFVEQAPPGYLPMLEATMKLGVSRQTLQPGELRILLSEHVVGGLRRLAFAPRHLPRYKA